MIDFSFLRQRGEAAEKTVVHITHSIDEAIRLGDRILVMGKPGRVVADLHDVTTRDRDELRVQILAHLQTPPDAPARFAERTRRDDRTISVQVSGWVSAAR